MIDTEGIEKSVKARFSKLLGVLALGHVNFIAPLQVPIDHMISDIYTHCHAVLFYSSPLTRIFFNEISMFISTNIDFLKGS